jgi:GntR family transcriptional regulator
MNLRINPSSGVPIYQQLMEQIKHAVDSGAIKAGEQLPTIRQVAAQLAMNPNTVARAYRELEREGVLEVRHGSGAYVGSPSTSIVKAAGIRRAAEALRPAMERGLAIGLSGSELRRVFEEELARLQETGLTRRRL